MYSLIQYQNSLIKDLHSFSLHSNNFTLTHSHTGFSSKGGGWIPRLEQSNRQWFILPRYSEKHNIKHDGADSAETGKTLFCWWVLLKFVRFCIWYKAKCSNIMSLFFPHRAQEGCYICRYVSLMSKNVTFLTVKHCDVSNFDSLITVCIVEKLLKLQYVRMSLKTMHKMPRTINRMWTIFKLCLCIVLQMYLLKLACLPTSHSPSLVQSLCASSVNTDPVLRDLQSGLLAARLTEPAILLHLA